MGKNFMGYNNASELLTAIGNKIKAKYTKPNTGIPKSDLATAVQTSLGKADSAVQPSSLVDVVNDGAKNRLDCSLYALKPINVIGVNNVSSWDGNVCTFKSGSTTIAVVTVNSDNSITIVASTGSSEMWFKLASNMQFNNEELFLSGCPEGGSAYTYAIELDISNVRDTGSGTAFTLVSDDVYIFVKANQSWTKTFYPMICTKAEYDISPKHEPHALGNQFLTPALIEQVDSGAKNIYDFTKSYQFDHCSVDSNGIYTTSSDSLPALRFQITAYNSSGARLADLNLNSAGHYPTIDNNGVYYWSFVLPSGTNYLTIGHNGSTYNGRYKYPVYDLLAGQTYVLRINVTQAINASGQFKWKDVILCTLADWKVSQKFVPYKANIIGVYSDYKSITTSTTLTTTGLKFTATEPGLYKVTASALFSSSKPTRLQINQSYTGTSWYTLVDERSTENTSALTGTAVYRLETGGGFELFVAYSSASSNFVGMVVEKIG